MTPAQRLTVLSSVGNSLKADDIERGLRGAEEDLRLHDREGEMKGKGRGKHKPRSNFWIESDGEWGLLTMPEIEEEDILEASEILDRNRGRASECGFASSYVLHGVSGNFGRTRRFLASRV